MIYLDNAATTRIDPVVLDEMMPFLTESFGNPGTIYPLGSKASDAVYLARGKVARFMNASRSNIVFTASGTEANNLAFNSNYFSKNRKGKDVILISSLEHSSVLRTAAFYESKFGMHVYKIASTPNGTIDFDDFYSKINEYDGRISLVSIMMANNELGSINNCYSIAQECRERGIPSHFDCVQAAGCVDINVGTLGCDYASISSHKIHGPKGVGALYIKDRNRATALIHGGGNQEFGLRGGTENVAGIVGFGKACELSGLADKSSIVGLKRKFASEINNVFKHTSLTQNIHFNAHSDMNLGKVLSLRIDGVDAETMVLALGARGVCVSSGSACRSLEQEPSEVLKAIGLSDNEARDTLRFSFSRMNTEDEVVEAAGIVASTALFIYNSYYCQ